MKWEIKKQRRLIVGSKAEKPNFNLLALLRKRHHARLAKRLKQQRKPMRSLDDLRRPSQARAYAYRDHEKS